MLKQIKLLTSQTTSTAQTEVLSQVLIHLNDQPGGSVTPYARPGSPAKAPGTVKVWKLPSTATALTLTVGQHAMLLGTPSPLTSGKGLIYWNLQWDVCQGS